MLHGIKNRSMRESLIWYGFRQQYFQPNSVLTKKFSLMKKPFALICLFVAGYWLLTSFSAGKPKANHATATVGYFKSRVLQYQNSDLAKTEQDILALSYAASENSLLLFDARIDDFAQSKLGRNKLKDNELSYACSVNDLETFKSRLAEFQGSELKDMTISRGALYYASSGYDMATFKTRLAEFEKSAYAHSDFSRYCDIYARSINDIDIFKDRLKEFSKSGMDNMAATPAALCYAAWAN
jgi:hypothetical protein